ncbi:MAG: hypothetical protein R3B47_06985 [Bacteroidia bacterium]
MKRILIVLLSMAMLLACNDKPASNHPKGDATAPTVRPEPVNVPEFNADTAYSLIEKQLAFSRAVPEQGPITVGTDGSTTGKAMLAFNAS